MINDRSISYSTDVSWRKLEALSVPFLLSLVSLLCFGKVVHAAHIGDDYSIFHRLRDGGPFAVWSGQDPVFRPVSAAMMWLLDFLGGPQLLAVANLVMMVATSIAIKAIVELLTRDRMIGSVAALLFVLNPTHHESVYWIACNNLMLSSLVGFTGTYLLLRGLLFNNNWLIATSILLYVLAFGARETAILFPAAGLVLSGFVVKKKKWLATSTTLICLMAILLIIRTQFLTSASVDTYSDQFIPAIALRNLLIGYTASVWPFGVSEFDQHRAAIVTLVMLLPVAVSALVLWRFQSDPKTWPGNIPYLLEGRVKLASRCWTLRELLLSLLVGFQFVRFVTQAFAYEWIGLFDSLPGTLTVVSIVLTASLLLLRPGPVILGCVSVVATAGKIILDVLRDGYVQFSPISQLLLVAELALLVLLVKPLTGDYGSWFKENRRFLVLGFASFFLVGIMLIPPVKIQFLILTWGWNLRHTYEATAFGAVAMSCFGIVLFGRNVFKALMGLVLVVTFVITSSIQIWPRMYDSSRTASEQLQRVVEAQPTRNVYVLSVGFPFMGDFHNILNAQGVQSKAVIFPAAASELSVPSAQNRVAVNRTGTSTFRLTVLGDAKLWWREDVPENIFKIHDESDFGGTVELSDYNSKLDQVISVDGFGRVTVH